MLEQLLNDSIVHNSSLLYNRFIEKINRINIINQQVTKKKKKNIKNIKFNEYK